MAESVLEHTVTGLSMVATDWFENIKSNPTVPKKCKMCKTYTVTLQLSNGGTLTDEAVFRAAGAGRNVYFLQQRRMVLKAFADDEKRYASNHVVEKEGLATWRPRLPGHLPWYYGHFVIQAQGHDGSMHRIDTLLVGRVGPTLETILQAMDTLSSKDLEEKVAKEFLLVVAACKHAFDQRLCFYPDLHMRNLCKDDITGQYFFVDLETPTRVEEHLTFSTCMSRANKYLTKQKSAKQTAGFSAFEQLAIRHIQDHWADVGNLGKLQADLGLSHLPAGFLPSHARASNSDQLRGAAEGIAGIEELCWGLVSGTVQ